MPKLFLRKLLEFQQKIDESMSLSDRYEASPGLGTFV